MTCFTTPEQMVKLAALRLLLCGQSLSTIPEASRTLGVSQRSVLPFLYHLRDRGEAHSCQSGRLWKAGPSKAWLKAKQPAMPREDGPRRTVIHSYANRTSSGQARRDPLVEALFGPAGAK